MALVIIGTVMQKTKNKNKTVHLFHIEPIVITRTCTVDANTPIGTNWVFPKAR